MDYKSQIYRFFFSTENFLCFAATIQILNYNLRLKYQRINHTKTNEDVNKQDNLISCNIGGKKQLSADCGERRGCSEVDPPRRYSFPSSRCNKSIHFHPPPPPPHYILPSLHPSVPDPCSQSASWLSEAIGFRPRPPQAFAGETERNGPLTKSSATPPTPFCNIPDIFHRFVRVGEGEKKDKTSERKEDDFAKQLISVPMLLQQFHDYFFYTHAS